MSELFSPTPDGALIGGRYRVERLLGRGGMASVHAVREIATGRPLAVKRLSRSADARQRALFEREYHTLHGLRHARIVEVYEYGTDQEGAFYSMELLSGSDLSACAPIGWREVCTILRDVAAILGVLHARRLLHRDLSPKNVWRLPDGHIKLIDFGALAPFGPPSEIAGTAPFVPPEAVRGQALDQRADLYALGALGYWLTTRTHAYPASSIGELERVWKRAPAQPSSLARLASNARLEPIPREFDLLISSLLRQEPAERPLNTEVLVDRLNAIAGSEPESSEIAVQGYLASKAFVGRTRERERVGELLRAAREGRGGAVLIEAAPGVGRTRLLEELAVAARLMGAVVLSANSGAASRPYGVASALGLRLLDALPVDAARAAAPYAALLGHVTPELRARLSVRRLAAAQDYGERRLRVQTALTSWLAAVSREHLLVVLLDDYGSCDEDSAAWIAGSLHELAQQRVLLIASAPRERALEQPPRVHRFGSLARRMRLAPLTAEETHELLRSVFGAVPYLQRFADRLQRVSEGNPAHCLELAEYLVRTGAVEYKDGMWVLPSELGAAQLPRSRRDPYALRLERVGPEARKLAQTLSVHASNFSFALAVAVAEQPALMANALAELLRRGVLLEADQGYRFAHETLRESLLAELDPTRAARAHRRLGRALLEAAQDDRRERMRAVTHLFLGGERALAERLVRQGAEYFIERDIAGLGSTVSALEQTVALYRAQGVDNYSLVHPLALLAVAGYFVDRRLGARYGEPAVRALVQLLRLELARKLRRVLGKKLALALALLVAGATLAAHFPRAPSLRGAIRLLLAAASALSGMAACCIDPKLAERYADAIEPLAAFGADHVAGFIHRFCRSMALQVKDRPSESVTEFRAMIARLEAEKPIREMPENLRINYLAGCLLTLGITECWREGPEGLKLADKLETFGPLYEMSADHLRASYYEAQGDLRRAASFRERVERHAIRLGSAWQMDTWAPADSTKIALRTQDAMVAKRAAQELSQLALEVPSLELEARHARGTYCMLRGAYAEAVTLLETEEPPASVVGWARTRGSLARALNGLGNYARAREVCLHTLSHLSREDLQFSVMNLSVQVELGLAEAGLGNFEAARAQLERLFSAHAETQGPLTLGALHEARAKLALVERDYDRCREQLAQMERWYRPTGIATLVERCELLARTLTLCLRPEADDEHGDHKLSADDLHLMTRVELILIGSERVASARAQRGLQIAVELSGARDGFILLVRGERELAARVGERAPDSELVSWARERLRSACTDDETIAVAQQSELRDEGVKTHGGLHYCVTPLWSSRADEAGAAGALVLGFAEPEPRFPAAEVLRMIADSVLDSLPG